jgi:hypothetical protein
MGIQAFPNILAEQPTRPALRIVVGNKSIVSMRVVDASSSDPEQIYDEDTLGCARGVVWAVVFQAALVIAVAVGWKLHFFLR